MSANTPTAEKNNSDPVYPASVLARISKLIKLAEDPGATSYESELASSRAQNMLNQYTCVRVFKKNEMSARMRLRRIGLGMR